MRSKKWFEIDRGSIPIIPTPPPPVVCYTEYVKGIIVAFVTETTRAFGYVVEMNNSGTSIPDYSVLQIDLQANGVAARLDLTTKNANSDYWHRYYYSHGTIDPSYLVFPKGTPFAISRDNAYVFVCMQNYTNGVVGFDGSNQIELFKINTSTMAVVLQTTLSVTADSYKWMACDDTYLYITGWTNSMKLAISNFAVSATGGSLNNYGGFVGAGSSFFIDDSQNCIYGYDDSGWPATSYIVKYNKDLDFVSSIAIPTMYARPTWIVSNGSYVYAATGYYPINAAVLVCPVTLSSIDITHLPGYDIATYLDVYGYMASIDNGANFDIWIHKLSGTTPLAKINAGDYGGLIAYSVSDDTVYSWNYTDPTGANWPWGGRNRFTSLTGSNLSLNWTAYAPNTPGVCP